MRKWTLPLALLAMLVLLACSPRVPAETSSRLVTLATFEGEIDPDAGTFVVRTTSPTGTSTGPSAALLIPTGPGTVTITNTGTLGPNVDGTGACAGQKVLSAPVRITLDYPFPGFAGGLYAELLTLSGTGAESCDNATPPPASGLDTSKGLWSYGTVRPGATTSDQTWQFKWTAGQKTTFTGRVVGVQGTRIDVSSATPACGLKWSPVIAYTRAVATGADRMAYAVRNASTIAFLDLNGGSQGTVTAPQTVTSLSSYTGPTAADDILWFATDSNVGVVYRGNEYHSAAGGTAVTYVVADPTLPNRAWIMSETGPWFRSVTFDTSGHGFVLGSTVPLGASPYGMAIGPAFSPATGTWIYVSASSGGANWIKAWDLSGTAKATLDTSSTACSLPGAMTFTADGKLWVAACAGGTPVCQYCTYTPASGISLGIPIPSTAEGSGALAVAPATTGSGYAVWALAENVNGASGGDQILQLAPGATAGATTSTMFTVKLPEHSSWGCGASTTCPTLTASPSVSGHPAYLWVTGYQGIYRMQTQ